MSAPFFSSASAMAASHRPRRRLHFKQPKLAHAVHTAHSRKRARHAGETLAPDISPGDEETAQNGLPSTQTYRRRRRPGKFLDSVAKTQKADGVEASVDVSSTKGQKLGLLVEERATCAVKPCPDLSSSRMPDAAMTGLRPPSASCLDLVPLDPGPLFERVDTAIVYEGPFPSFTRPLPEDCVEVCNRLSLLHGPLKEYEKHRAKRISEEKVLHLEYHKEDVRVVPSGSLSEGVQPSGTELRRTVLDALIGTILSQNTTDTNSRRAFAALKAKFPSWESVYVADPKELEDAIRCGGLAEIKASRILSILKTLNMERGKLCLEYIRELSADEIKLELSRFKGVGPKTIACVLMFHLQQNEFPVDTHVFRITKMLGWVPERADREKAYMHLNHRIPDHLKFDLHCLFVTHGKSCPRCAKGGRPQRPADGPCPLVNLKQKCLESSHYKPLSLLEEKLHE